ncbi:beta strand repeat-containing protein, partial [Schlesneria sp.]
GGYGIRVETSGTSTSNNLLIRNNEISNNGTGITGAGISAFTGGGLALERHDSSTLNAIIDSNIISSNFNDGISLRSDGTSTGGMTVVSRDNDVLNNAGNGLQISTDGNARLNFTSQRDNYSGNGAGSGNNIDTTGGDNMAFVSNGNSVLDVTLQNVFSNSSSGTGETSNGVPTGNGLSGTTNGSSTLNLLVTGSSLSNNRLNGIVLNSNDRSYMHASIYDTLMNSNNENGILFNRASASLVRANIVNSSMQSNLVNGFNFHGLGNDPEDPTQKYPGPNRINLIQSSLNNNGINGVGQGARVDLLGDSQLVLNATATTFNNNAQNGLRVSLSPGAEFGYTMGNERSTFDNVQINNNGSNGIFMTSTITPTDQTTNNPVLPYDAPSVTFMQVSANTGSTEINGNGFGANATGLSGILAQYLGGDHDILVQGDTVNATPKYGTFIQGNRGDGIFVQSAISADTQLTVDRVIVGGPLAINANGGHGINFQTVSKLTIVDGADSTTWLFNGAGRATLNVTESVVQGNTLNGINLFGNGFSDVSLTSDGTGNWSSDPGGVLNANISDSQIAGNGGSGVNILLQGNFGGFRYSASDIDATEYSTFNLVGNNIHDNGAFGVKMEQNAGYARTDYFVLFQDTNADADPPIPFNPNDTQNNGLGNTGYNTSIKDADRLSNYMFLPTLNNAKLNLYNNNIQYNGRAGDLRAADGVFIRVSTQSYLAADILNNRMTGNVANDLHVESFVQYNPQNGQTWQPLLSVRATPPDPSTVYLDYTAQMDMRLRGNIGNTVNIQDPMVNTLRDGSNVYMPLDGNSTPNGAVLGSRDASNADPFKDNNISNFGYENPLPRLVQLFQIDDGNNLNVTNNFSQNGVTQDLQNAFYNGNFHLRAFQDPDFPNPDFPLYFGDSPGNPFLP